MAFSDDQLFYAALYWVTALPGGAAFVPDLCKQYSKPLMTFDPVYEAELPPVTKEKCETFMTVLYHDLESGQGATFTGYDGVRFFDLKCGMSGKVDRHFCPLLDRALVVSAINQDLLSKAGRVFIHENGQVFARRAGQSNLEIYELDYPGRPALDYPSYPNFKESDMKDCFDVLSENVYRVVPLAEGQKYVWSYVSIAGTHHRNEYDNYNKDDVILVKSCDAADLKALTDEDIITANPDKVRATMPGSKDSYVPGYISDKDKVTVEATDDPRIVKELWGPIKCMKVKEKMQIGYGINFRVANPGDIIYAHPQGGASPYVWKHEDILNGQVTLIDQTPGHVLLRGIDKGRKAPAFKLKP